MTSVGQHPRRGQQTISRREGRAGRAFVLPVLVVLLALVAYPLIFGFYISFFDTNLINRWDFVGVQHYQRLFSDLEFLQRVGKTFVFAFLVVGGNLIVGTAAALLLNLDIRFRTFFRVVLVLPWLFPEVVIALIWKWMYNPLYGLFSNGLLSAGLVERPVAWLDNPDFALLAVAGACIWKGYPLVLILVMAGLQSIPKEMYEAAHLDGAGGIKSFRHITLPLLKPVLLVVTVLETVWWFKHFTIVWLMTAGGPAGATSLVSIDIYTMAFRSFQWGRGSAAAVIVLMICLGISAIYRRVLRNGDDD